MRRTSLQLVGAVALGLSALVIDASPASAAIITIGFEADSNDLKPNGFQSADSDVVTFSDSVGADLYVYDGGPETDGQGLGVFYDDASELVMDFAVPVGSVSLDFGNDQGSHILEGGVAYLALYNGDDLVGEAIVEVNRNDVMDQTITATATGFADRATFQYQNADRTPAGLIEVVDNIIIETVETVCDDGIDDDNDELVDADDPDCPLPILAVGDASVTEGNSGSRDLVFPVTLSAPFPGTEVRVDYEVTGGTATSDDVAAMSGSITLAPGATEGEIRIAVMGDIDVEADETFTLALTVTSDGERVPAAPEVGPVGTIANDDSAAPQPTSAPTHAPTPTPAALPVVVTPTYTG